jgi:hypothetical protein
MLPEISFRVIVPRDRNRLSSCGQTLHQVEQSSSEHLNLGAKCLDTQCLSCVPISLDSIGQDRLHNLDLQLRLRMFHHWPILTALIGPDVDLSILAVTLFLLKARPEYSLIWQHHLKRSDVI